MYAVVRYQNYRKEQDIKVLNVFFDRENAITKAYEYAENEIMSSDGKILDYVEEQYLFVYDVIAEYSVDSSIYVFAVITLPQPE